jgi:hypothetical protein
MKRNDFILLCLVTCYSYLFYHQSTGINFFIFSLLICVALIFKKPDSYRNFSWKIAASGVLISGFFTFWHGHTLAAVANIISLSILSGLTFHSGSSIIIAGMNSLYSMIVSFFMKTFDYLASEISNTQQRNQSSMIHKKVLAIGIPILITIIFFFLYRSANAAFYEITEKINFDFINTEWIVFTFTGLLILYGVFNQKTIDFITNADKNASNTLFKNKLREHSKTFIGKLLNQENELLSGILMLTLLNILLLSVNIIDIRYLWGGIKLPEGLSYSEYVHKGIGMIIFSILSAIAIILFYFRGHLNFHKQNKMLKITACIWIVQNIFMLVSTSYRNQLYIEEYSLTYKRIGVYVYLLLTFTGLVITYFKIYFKKSNWFLFRKNASVFYCFLIFSTLVNWDNLITNYNLKHSANPDYIYLLNLDFHNIPLILKSQPDRFISADSEYIKQMSMNKTIIFEDDYHQSDWQSMSYSKYRVHKFLTETKLKHEH